MRQFADSEPAAVGTLLAKPAVWLAADLARVQEQLALDEVMLEEAHEGRLIAPLARTWMAIEPTVVVGSSSRIDEEVDRAACDRLGVRILRRPSGGLTVVLGPGCVMWTVIVPLTGPQPPIDRIHAALLDPLCEALRETGKPVVRRGSSDLAIESADGDRKVSGNALRIRRGGILYHGTLLDAFDLDLVGTVLRHPPREPDYRGSRAHGAFLANLGIGRAAIDTAVQQAFRAEATPVAWPRERVKALVCERYDSAEWTEHRC
jgi:lipoate-protein ligase A